LKILTLLGVSHQPSPALLKELRKAVTSARKMRPTVPTGSRNTPFGGTSTASHRSSSKVAGKRKANELAGSGDSTETAGYAFVHNR